MGLDSSFDISTLRFRLKVAEDKVKRFESGEKYAQMMNQFKSAGREYQSKINHPEYELSKAHSRTISVRKIWSEVFDDIYKEQKAKNLAHEKEVSALKERIPELERQRDAAKDELRDNRQELYVVKGELEDAKEEIAGLKAGLNKDYSNSSKSSSQSPNHKTIPNGREKSGKKPGGQTGHPHHGRKKQEPTESYEVPAPEEYLDKDKFRPTGNVIHKQLVIAGLVLSVQDFYTGEYRNAETGRRVHAEFPLNLKDEVTYDGSVKALAYLLNSECNVSIGKVHTFLKEISGGKLDLSTGAICNLSGEFSEKTVDERNEIFLKPAASDTMHSDFTFSRVNGKQAAVIICCTPENVLYQGREKKGDEGVKDSPLEFHDGILISDHEAALIKHGSKRRECMSHVNRYIIGSIQNEPEREWNKLMKQWISDALAYKEKLNNGEPVNAETVKSFEDRYDGIMAKGREEYDYIPPSDYYKEGYNLHRRMAEDKDSYILFLKDPSVPATNNDAERNAGKVKRKGAQVMCFRSQSGIDYYCDGLSIIESIKARDENLYENVTLIFNKDRV